MAEVKVEPYIVSDTPFAAYLHYRGMELLSTIPDKFDRKRRAFVFVDIPERVQYEADWDKDIGGFRKYFKSLKTVQHMIYNGVKTLPQ
jgi:hypothetical protein